ncbi:hypothetical protein F2Q68_00033864 [Brassica cretica]|uniref:Uncharacterized protein n=1 Tax=Brassica cretica TaxID=69181 RepID=A0A8S9GY47_BRACR|nr:hypothetical protein F2Q68_00033864 [Brassica cretica]
MCSSEYSEGISPRNIPTDTLPRNIPTAKVSRNIPTAVVPRNIPRAYLLGISRRIHFLGIFRRKRFLGIIRGPKFVGIFRYLLSLGMFPRTIPSEISEEIPTNSPRKCFFGMSSESLILGIPSKFSEEIPRKFYFPTRNFRRPFSSVCPRNTVIPRTYRRYLSLEYRCFL